MHPRNPYANRTPDFAELAKRYPTFAPFVTTTPDGYSNIDWKDSDALRALTCALLKEDWQLDVDIPPDRLCPTVANRLDYIYHVLDLRDHLGGDSSGSSRPLRLLDIGTGAVAIYPLLIHRICPDATIVATEKDDISLRHAQKTIEQNNIPSSIISLRQPPSDAILFPLLDDEECRIDMMMCNPPFFSSADEMQAGQAIKADAAHTAHTGADNEMVTDGGEVGFVSRMIFESQKIGTRCSWYTSLIGRYSSLPRLTTKLREAKVDNYYILSIRPAKTVRWIIIWSYTAIRLPDEMTRPGFASSFGDTSFTRLLPPPNTVRHVLRPVRSGAEIRAALLPFLERIQLSHSPADPDSDPHSEEIKLEARGNTWSRAARRKLAQQQHQLQDSANTDHAAEVPITLQATLRILDGSVELDWTYGRDRADFDSLWKSLLANTGLVDRSATTTTGSTDTSSTSAGKKRKAEGQGRGPSDK